ncbi:MAG: hypothetical protein OEV48_07225 [Acidobacteriota bacterium]|nr:hypothetical protein [Acidobacteriota bacterium]
MHDRMHTEYIAVPQTGLDFAAAKAPADAAAARRLDGPICLAC